MIHPQLSKGLLLCLFSCVAVASTLAETIGDAKVTEQPANGLLTIREYPFMAEASPGRANEVDPRFRFAASLPDIGDGESWKIEVYLTEAGRATSPAVTFREYMALVDQCLDRFMKDVPGGKVEEVILDHTNDSQILADIVKKLRPRFEANVRNPPPPPNEIMKGKALEFPEDAMHIFVLAANSSATTRQIGGEMAHRLGRRYLKVVNGADALGFDRKGGFYGKPWGELLQDPHLGIGLWSLQLDFIFGPPRS